MNDTTGRELTFGEKAVGLTFNPSSNPMVESIKKNFAKVIDELNYIREDIQEHKDDLPELSKSRGEQIRMLSVAITEAQTAQMWAVKAVTWK